MRLPLIPACVSLALLLGAVACGSPPGTPAAPKAISDSAPPRQSAPTESLKTTNRPSVTDSTDAAVQTDAMAAVDQAAAAFPRPPSASTVPPNRRLTDGFVIPPGNVVHATIYLSSEASVQDTLAFFASAFADQNVTSSIGDFSDGSTHVKIMQLALPGGGRGFSAPMAQIGVAAAPAGGVMIGVQISSVWEPVRPANTYIGSSPGVVDVRQGSAYAHPTFRGRVTGAGAVRLAVAVDALGITTSALFSCTSAVPTSTELTFHPSGRVITVTLLNGCPYGPFLVVDGQTYTLASTGTIGSVLRSVLPALPSG